jgi:hypothetical protein
MDTMKTVSTTRSDVIQPGYFYPPPERLPFVNADENRDPLTVKGDNHMVQLMSMCCTNEASLPDPVYNVSEQLGEELPFAAECAVAKAKTYGSA